MFMSIRYACGPFIAYKGIFVILVVKGINVILCDIWLRPHCYVDIFAVYGSRRS